MKKGIKVFIRLPTILLLLIFPIVSAWAASKNKPDSLTAKEITVGIMILMASLFIPALGVFEKIDNSQTSAYCSGDTLR